MEKQISLSLTKLAKDFIAEESYNPMFGARPVKRYLQKMVETELGRSIIRGDVGEGDNVVIDVEDHKLVLR